MSGQDTSDSAIATDASEVSNDPVRLAGFIRANVDTIVTEWEAFASTLTPASNSMTPLQLRNHIRQMLDFLVQDIEKRQTTSEERLKSLGMSAKRPEATASELHAALRLAGGFDISQMVSEFRALRASIMRLWQQRNSVSSPDPIDALRFNESIDQMISETVLYYTENVRKTQDLFLGIVGHDLRNPLQAVMGCLDLLPLVGPLTEGQANFLRQAGISSQRMAEMLDELVDLTRARLGSGLKIVRAPMDAAFVLHQTAQEMQAGHPLNRVKVDVSGVLAVDWDRARFGQLISNLLGNALQYGFQGTQISVVLDGRSDATVTLSVHNIGLPIPAAKMPTLFEPLTRARSADAPLAEGSHLGLGLFIANDIVGAHGGTLSVTSTEKDGTTFTAMLPRNAILAVPKTT